MLSVSKHDLEAEISLRHRSTPHTAQGQASSR